VIDWEVRPEVDKRYKRYVLEHHGEIDTLHLCEVMFNAGERNAIERMVRFTEVPVLLREAQRQLRDLTALVRSLTGS
jgi:hypothetical protein